MYCNAKDGKKGLPGNCILIQHFPAVPFYLHSMTLFGIVRNTRFTYYIDFDLPRILQLVFDLLRNIPGHQYHICVRYLLWNYHNPNLSTCLNRKRFVNTLKLIGDVL